MEYKKIIIDTSVWVSLFNEEDSNYKKALKFKCVCFGEQTMPDLIFYETLTILKNKIKDVKLLNRFTEFTYNNLDVTIRLFYENNIDVLKLFLNEKKDGLSYVDTLLLFLSKEYHILTFDEDLKKKIREVGGKLID